MQINNTLKVQTSLKELYFNYKKIIIGLMGILGIKSEFFFDEWNLYKSAFPSSS